MRSVREKEENMKTVESLLEKGLIEVANKEEELKVCVLARSRKSAGDSVAPRRTPRNAPFLFILICSCRLQKTRTKR